MPQYAPMVIRGRGGLPQYQPSGQHYTPGQGISARIDPGYIATIERAAENNIKGLGMLGNAIDKAGRTVGGIADQYGRMKALQAYRGYVEEMNYYLYNRDNGVLTTTHGENAFAVQEQIREHQRELHKKYIGDGAGSVFGIDMYFNQDAYDYDQRTYQQGMQHSAREYDRWVPAQLKATADMSYQQAIMNADDPVAYHKYMDDAEKALAVMMIDHQGQGMAEVGVALQRGRHDVEKAVMDGWFARKDYGAAAKALGLSGYTASGGRRPGLGDPRLGSTFSERISGLTGAFSGTKYSRSGSRNPYSGSTDCSGWLMHTAKDLNAAGILDEKHLAAVLHGNTSEGIITGLAKLNGTPMLGKEALKPGMARAGMVIGLDTGHYDFDQGRAIGIDHVIVLYNDPKSGVLCVSESSGGKNGGVHGTPYDEWFARTEKRHPGFKMYGTTLVDPEVAEQKGGADLPHSQAVDAPKGLAVAGNIDLYNRPVHDAGNGEIRTVNSISFGETQDDGRVLEVVVPTIVEEGGRTRQLSDEEAIAHYRKTGQHMGKFTSAADAEEYAQAVHEDHARRYSKPTTWGAIAAGEKRDIAQSERDIARSGSDISKEQRDIARPETDIAQPSVSLGAGTFRNLTPAEWGHYKSMLDAKEKAEAEQRQKAKKEAEKDARANAVTSGVQQVNDLFRNMGQDATREEKEAEAYQYIQANCPKELRADVMKAVSDQLKQEDIAHNAEATKVSSAFQRTIMSKQGSWQAKKDAIRQANPADYTVDNVAFKRAQEKMMKACDDARDGKDNAKDSAANLAEFYRWYDAQVAINPNVVYDRLFNTNLNSADYAKAEQYRGIEELYPFSRIEPLIDQVLGKNSLTDSEKMAIYETVRHNMGSNQWDNERLRAEIRIADTKTKGGDKLYEAKPGEHVDLDISPERMDRAVAKLEAGFPGWKGLPGVAREVLAKALVYRESYHTNYVPTEKETKDLNRLLPGWDSDLEKVRNGGA